ncbi:hypothetical protein GQ457_08G037170 [Hibiscus cannabinus]
MHILLFGLSEQVSKKVSTCKRAKEMWEKLEKLHGKKEKKDGVPSCVNLLPSSKVDGVLALNESKTIKSKFKRMISKLEFENVFLLKTKLDFEN